MKKLLALLLAFVICAVSFAGCGGDEPAVNENESSAQNSEAASESSDSESEAENMYGNSEKEIAARYLGDWCGLLKIQDCTSAYSNLEGAVTGACARIVYDSDGNLIPFIGFALDGVYLTSAEGTINLGSESIFISGTYNVGSYSNVEILEYMPGTITMNFPVDMQGEGFNIVVNLRRIGDENWTAEDPGMSQADLDYVRGMTFEELAQSMGYDSNGYPPASYLENGTGSFGPSGGTSAVTGEKEGADGMVADYATLKAGLEWCKTERTYDTTYDEIAAQFGVHGFFVDEYGDKPYRRYRWFYDDSNYVTITFEVKADGTETWNVTAWEGIKD